MTPLSILDLVPIKDDTTPGEALRESLDLARQAERLGYNRYWVAEHHNMVGIGSAGAFMVTPGFIQSLAARMAGTSRIRTEAGGFSAAWTRAARIWLTVTKPNRSAPSRVAGIRSRIL